MKIYSLNLVDFSDSDYISAFESMSDERKARVEKLGNAAQKRARVAADMLCRKAISETCGYNAADIIFQTNEYGKPYAANADVFFNISHSADAVVCAVSENEIGIDIEKIRPTHPNTVKRFATESELEYINNDINKQFTVWCLKEAYFKCIGTGLNSKIKDVEFSFDGGISCSAENFSLSLHTVFDGYVCAVCEKNNNK